MSKNEQPAKGKAEGMTETSQAKAETVLTAVVQSIEEKIQYYQRKQELIQRYKSLEESSTKIMEHVESLQKEKGEDVFISEAYKLALTVKSGYRDEREILTFRDPDIMGEMLHYVLGKIATKLQKLSREIAEN